MSDLRIEQPDSTEDTPSELRTKFCEITIFCHIGNEVKRIDSRFPQQSAAIDNEIPKAVWVLNYRQMDPNWYE